MKLTRRSFLKGLAAAAASMCVAAELIGLATEKPPKSAPPQGYEWVQDPYPLRYVFEDGEYRQVPAFKIVEGTNTVSLNPEWVDAPFEDKIVWSGAL